MSTFTGNADALGIDKSQMEDAQDYELYNDDGSEDAINTPTNVAPNEKSNYWHPHINELPLMFQKQVGKEGIFLKLQPQNLNVNSNLKNKLLVRLTPGPPQSLSPSVSAARAHPDIEPAHSLRKVITQK